MQNTSSSEPHLAAWARREYEQLLAVRSALVAVDAVRYDLFAKALYRCAPAEEDAGDSRFAVHHAESERLVANVLAAFSRLARHLDSHL